ncbi:hypothetical protein CCP4SC76_2110001 [Gammaproteobacteria bacterium]
MFCNDVDYKECLTMAVTLLTAIELIMLGVMM